MKYLYLLVLLFLIFTSFTVYSRIRDYSLVISSVSLNNIIQENPTLLWKPQIIATSTPMIWPVDVPSIPTIKQIKDCPHFADNMCSGN